MLVDFEIIQYTSIEYDGSKLNIHKDRKLNIN